MLILVFHRLLAGLLDVNIVWQFNDIARAAFSCGLSYAFLRYISYLDLKLKCIAAIFFGYSVADLLICLIYYKYNIGGYLLATSIQITSMIVTFIIYWFRSYVAHSDTIDDDSIYCLRRKPNSKQDFFISLLGCFGPYGAYVIVQNRQAYLFRNGKLQKVELSKLSLDRYHITKGKLRPDMNLDSKVGIQWELFGNNCITILGRYWSRYGR